MGVRLAATVLLGLLALESPVVAQSNQTRAGQLLSEGIALRRNGEDAAALQRFQQAVHLHPTPRAFAQVALAEQALGRWLEAETHLQQALANGDDPWVAKHREVLERSLSKIGQHLGSVEVLGDLPPGTEVGINGRVAATLPLARPLRVKAGTVVLSLQAEGF